MTTHPLDRALAKASQPLDDSAAPFHRKLGDLGKYVSIAVELYSDERRIDYLVEVIRMCRSWWEEPRCEWGEHRVDEFANAIRLAYEYFLEAYKTSHFTNHEWAQAIIFGLAGVAEKIPPEDKSSTGKPNGVFDARLVLLATFATIWLQSILDRDHLR